MDASYCDIFAVRFAPESKESKESGERIRRIRGIRAQNPKNPENPERESEESGRRIRRIQRNPERESEESGRESKESTENLKNPGSRVQRSRLYIFCKQYCRCMTPLPPSSNTPLHDQSWMLNINMFSDHSGVRRTFCWHVISFTKRINSYHNS